MGARRPSPGESGLVRGKRALQLLQQCLQPRRAAAEHGVQLGAAKHAAQAAASGGAEEAGRGRLRSRQRNAQQRHARLIAAPALSGTCCPCRTGRERRRARAPWAPPPGGAAAQPAGPAQRLANPARGAGPRRLAGPGSRGTRPPGVPRGRRQGRATRWPGWPTGAARRGARPSGPAAHAKRGCWGE